MAFGLKNITSFHGYSMAVAVALYLRYRGLEISAENLDMLIDIEGGELPDKMSPFQEKALDGLLEYVDDGSLQQLSNHAIPVDMPSLQAVPHTYEPMRVKVLELVEILPQAENEIDEREIMEGFITRLALKVISALGNKRRDLTEENFNAVAEKLELENINRMIRHMVFMKLQELRKYTDEQCAALSQIIEVPEITTEQEREQLIALVKKAFLEEIN